MVAVDGVIAPMALQLAGQFQGLVGAALAQAADPGPDVIGVLQRDATSEDEALRRSCGLTGRTDQSKPMNCVILITC